MKLGMTQTLRMAMQCEVCGELMPDHDPECPVGKRAEWAKSILLFQCNRKGCRGFVEANVDDYLECRKCRTVYNRGASHEDHMEKTRLFKVGYETFDDIVEMTVFREKGHGRFVSDIVLRRFREEEARWRKARRGKP